MRQFLALLAILVPLSLFTVGCGSSGGGGGASKPSEDETQKRRAEMERKMKAGKLSQPQAPGAK